MTDVRQTEPEAIRQSSDEEGGRTARPRLRRTGWLAIAGVTVGVALALSIASFGWPLPGGWFGRRDDASHFAPLPSLDPESQALRDEAFKAAEDLVEQFPYDPDALYSKAGIHNRFGDSQTAVNCWNRCIELDPKFALAYYCLGWDAFDRGECEKSVQFLQKAVELDPKITHAYLLLGKALIDLGRMEDTIQPLEKHVRLAPRSAEGLFQLGQVYLHEEQYESAKRYYLAVLEIEPDSDLAYYGLANACERQGEEQQAAEYRERFAELKEERLQRSRQRKRSDQDGRNELQAAVAFAHTDVAKVYRAHGALQEATQHLRRSAELSPEDTECRKLLVTIYRESGNNREALRFLQELADLEPGDVVHQINLGVLGSELGEFETAEKAFLQVQQMLPENPEGYAGLANLYLESNRNHAAAEESAQKAVDLAPVADHYYLLGLSQLKCGKRKEALQSLERAVQLEPGNPLVREVYETLKRSL